MNLVSWDENTVRMCDSIHRTQNKIYLISVIIISLIGLLASIPHWESLTNKMSFAPILYLEDLSIGCVMHQCILNTDFGIFFEIFCTYHGNLSCNLLYHNRHTSTPTHRQTHQMNYHFAGTTFMWNTHRHIEDETLWKELIQTVGEFRSGNKSEPWSATGCQFEISLLPK